MMEKENEKDEYKEVLDLIENKSVVKRDIFELTEKRFEDFKRQLVALVEQWKVDVSKIDPRLEIGYKDLGKYYCQITIAGDVILFYMHTNIFHFAKNSMYWKSGYLREDENRGYCGTIQVYNFLADSFRFNRKEDIGYMMARIFINYENHFFLEGKDELGYMFNDFVNSELNDGCIHKIILAIVKSSLEFDLFCPNYDDVAQISVKDATSLKDIISLTTGKRLGFQFGTETETVD